MTDYKALWQQMCQRCDELDKRLAQLEYKLTSDHQLMENAQGELERIKLVQTGVGIEQRAEEAYEAAKQRNWVGVSDEAAQPEQEPVAVWELFEDGWDSIADPEWMETLPVGTKLYTTPPQRTWVGLTQEELSEIYNRTEWDTVNGWEYERAIESKLKEKNT